MRNKIFKIVFILAAAVLLLSPFSVIRAETDPRTERQQLEDQLKELEAKISQYEKDITKTQQEKKTLQNQVYILKKKIETLNLQIKQSNIMIEDLSLQIADTEKSIEQTQLKIEDSQEKLSATLRLIYEEDQRSLVEIILSEPKLSDFFDNLVSLEALSSKSKDLLKDIKALKGDLENQKQSLDSEKEELEGISRMQTLQRQESESTRKDQEKLLELTKGKESEYQKILKISKEMAAQIRTRIFELVGVPDAPTFGEALEIAKYVENTTGVRAAYVLAILSQESNMGKNVGQCYLKDKATGTGTVAKSGKAISRVMKPTRDVEPFMTITAEWSRDPFKTLVSCPMSYGWGGAMGPAQFIPSTWAMYKDRIKAVTGSADPWKIKDAFVATALYVKDKGAASQTYNDEWRAAISYFSGSVNLTYRFYGDSVMNIAKKYEEDIKSIEAGQ